MKRIFIDPGFGVTKCASAVASGDTIRLVEIPIEEHSFFSTICEISPWQRERFVRAGNAWISPSIQRKES